MIATETLVGLLSVPNLGRRSVQKALDNAGQRSLKTANKIKAYLDEVLGSHSPSAEDIGIGFEKAQRIIEQARELGVTPLGKGEETFPPQLRSIPDPPLVVYAKGNLGCLTASLAVAVVGTRKPTPQGQRAARQLGARMAIDGIVVVSGLALGCDTEAHLGCLDEGGQTVAVLAHGLDTVYPAKNRDLASRILEHGGCLVSEYPPGEKPQTYFFIERDRIQSGLSAGVVVVETQTKGGTMHTARFCIAQGRVLACWWPPGKHQAHANVQGNRQLIGDGALRLAGGPDVARFVTEVNEKHRQLFAHGKKPSPRKTSPHPRKPKDTKSIEPIQGELFPEEDS